MSGIRSRSPRPATIADVAKVAGVSHMTVSRVLTGSASVKLRTRERVEQAARELGYSPNALARGLASRRTGVIGFLASDISNLYIAELARGVHRFADDVGSVVIMLFTDYSAEREARAIDVLLQRRVDGLIVSPPRVGDDGRIRALADSGLPVVSVARFLGHPGIPDVTPRVEEATYRATEHLIDLGHRRIAYIAGAPGVNFGRTKVEGYQKALRDRGIPIEDDLVVFSDLTVRDALSAADMLLRRPHPPTAIMGVTDTIAIGAMSAVQAMGLRVPDDVSIIGFDDIPFATTVHPPLTTIMQPAYEMGRTASRLLFDIIERGVDDEATRIWMDCALVIRGSTGRRRGPVATNDPIAAG